MVLDHDDDRPLVDGEIALRGPVLLLAEGIKESVRAPEPLSEVIIEVFEGLQGLHSELGERGLEVLGFPCNQFGKQDPGTNDEIQEFCQLNYGVSFPMFGKIEVNGSGTDPLFKHLKKQAPGALGTQRIKWNFTKFLIDGNGNVVRRYAPKDTPKAIARDIETLLD